MKILPGFKAEKKKKKKEKEKRKKMKLCRHTHTHTHKDYINKRYAELRVPNTCLLNVSSLLLLLKVLIFLCIITLFSIILSYKGIRLSEQEKWKTLNCHP